MKKLVSVIIALFLFAISTLIAHPASNVSAVFDKDEGLLTVSFKHQVKDNADHFISEVKVLKNKKEIIIQKISFQDTNDGGSVVYKINDAKAKDKLEIVTICNKTGKKSYSLDIK